MIRFSVGLLIGLLLLGGAAAIRRRSPAEERPRNMGRDRREAAPERPRPPAAVERRAPAREEAPALVGLPNGPVGWDLDAVEAARREEREARAKEEAFWNDIGTLMSSRASADPARHRESVMARTATLLGFEGATRNQFEHTASAAAEEIRRSWEVRDEAVLSGGRAEQAQAQYEAAKAQALGGVASLLQHSALHDRFRARLEEWIDAVR